jgi:hypothetical protein
MTFGAEAQAETASNGDASPADGIEGDHGDQHEREEEQWRAALPIAPSPSEDNHGGGDWKRSGEEHAAGLREPKPLTKPSPIASDSGHARMLVRRTSSTLRQCSGITPE